MPWAAPIGNSHHQPNLAHWQTSFYHLLRDNSWFFWPMASWTGAYLLWTSSIFGIIAPFSTQKSYQTNVACWLVAMCITVWSKTNNSPSFVLTMSVSSHGAVIAGMKKGSGVLNYWHKTYPHCRWKGDTKPQTIVCLGADVWCIFSNDDEVIGRQGPYFGMCSWTWPPLPENFNQDEWAFVVSHSIK